MKKREVSIAVFRVPIRDCRLDHIFDCGQCFRWRREEEESFVGIAMGEAVRISLKEQDSLAGILTVQRLASRADHNWPGDRTKAEASFRDRWRRYLDLDRDYGKIKESLLEADPSLAAPIQQGGGIRILQQDLWEAILSFLLSQNNNVTRIKSGLESLAELGGAPLLDDKGYPPSLPAGLKAFDFPSHDQLAPLSVQDLAPAHLGYRAPYVIETSRRILNGGWPEDMADLLRLPGVGPKVADCISLFGMGKTGHFPLDVWMKRLMAERYGFDLRDTRAMASFAREKYGSLAGFAQQYLFYWARDRKNHPFG